MSRLLNDLTFEFRLVAMELIARCAEQGIPVMIVDTLRTQLEQEENLKKGVSWTLNSKHLTGNAIDLAPYDVYQLHGPDKLKWDSNDPVWQKIGTIGKSLGLIWGGDWKQKDMGHFEIAVISSNSNPIT